MDALFDELTVQEHLDLLYTLSGYQAQQDLLRDVALQDDFWKRTTELSGGMKRRLSMAMALVGNPLILILDGTLYATFPTRFCVLPLFAC